MRNYDVAVWQFPVMLIPAMKAQQISNEGDFKSFLTADGWDLAHFWVDRGDATFAKLAIEKHLGTGHVNELFEDTIFWGQERGNDLHFHYERKQVIDIFVRLDMRSLDLKFIESVTLIARSLRCHIFIMEKHIAVKPTVEKLEYYAKNSRAAINAHLYHDL